MSDQIFSEIAKNTKGKKILLIGSSGNIGGRALEILLKYGKASSITAFDKKEPKIKEEKKSKKPATKKEDKPKKKPEVKKEKIIKKPAKKKEDKSKKELKPAKEKKEKTTSKKQKKETK